MFLPNPDSTSLRQALLNAIAVFPAGNAFKNILTSTYTQVKTGLGVLAGLTVNTGGTTSTVALYNGTSSAVTMTIATPGVISWPAQPFVAGGGVKFTSTGALPTGLTIGTTYYVSSAGLAAGSFRVADTAAHAIAGTNTINTSGSQSGVHTGWDVSDPIGTYPTTTAGLSPQIGAQFSQGLFVVTADGGGAADVTVLYR